MLSCQSDVCPAYAPSRILLRSFRTPPYVGEGDTKVTQFTMVTTPNL